MLSALLLGLVSLSGACQDEPQTGPNTQGSDSQGPEQDPDQGPEQGPGDEPDKPEAVIDCDALVATGNDPGEIPVDLTRLASSGQEVSVRSYCNDPLLVLSGTAYCAN